MRLTNRDLARLLQAAPQSREGGGVISDCGWRIADCGFKRDRRTQGQTAAPGTMNRPAENRRPVNGAQQIRRARFSGRPISARAFMPG